jgi:hypothetical protein
MSTKNLDLSKLLTGWGTEDITPTGPVKLYGQYYERISKYVQSPLTVTACAIESISVSGEKDQVIMVSMDLLYTPKELQNSLRSEVKKLKSDIETNKVFLNATHTHSAPEPDVHSDYGKLLLDKLSKAVISAWNNRRMSGISRGLDYVSIGHNRRVSYADGTAEMYGETNRADCIGLEGPEDDGVNMLFCWDETKNLTGIIMNVPCPAQVTESKYFISSDYWGEFRKLLEKKFNRNIYVLAQCGAAGDLSPRDLPRGYKKGLPNMWDISGMRVIGKKLFNSSMEAYTIAQKNIQTSTFFKHLVKNITIPSRKISKEEYEEALRISNEIHAREPKDPNSPNTAWNRFLNEIKENEKVKDFGPWDNKKSDFGILKKKDLLIEQYRDRESHLFYEMELHVIRIGDIAMASNPFELFVDYGFRIMGRSKAEQTFLIQMSCDIIDYLPTERAVQGGGYSAMSNKVGPEAGNVLVEETTSMINILWK